MEGKQIGALVIAAMGVIIALVILTGGVTHGVGQLTTTTPITDELVTLAANGAKLDLPACTNIAGSMVVENRTGTLVITSGNYSTGTRLSTTTGNKVLYIQTDAATFASSPVNLTYTCLPQGYAEDSASRTIASLIILLAIIAVVAFVLFYAAANLKGMY